MKWIIRCKFYQITLFSKYIGGVQKSEKNFFAFLDELGHSEYFLKLKKKKKKVEKGPFPPPPPLKSWKIPTFFFFSYFEGFPYLHNTHSYRPSKYYTFLPEKSNECKNKTEVLTLCPSPPESKPFHIQPDLC